MSEWKDLLPREEYEGMYGDTATRNLYILCKNCSGDTKTDKISGYILHVGDSIKVTGNFTIDIKQLKPFNGSVKKGFRPSAFAKNNITNQWYIVSAVNKMLVVADEDFNIVEVAHLDGNHFNQPEGIAFDKDGNMYISNEGDDMTNGNILKFKRMDRQEK